MFGLHSIDKPTGVNAREIVKRVPRHWLPLIPLALVSAAVYWHLTVLSAQFAFGSAKAQRPIPTVLAWFGVVFVLHLVALWCGLRSPRRTVTALVIFAAAIVFRVIMLQSEPIQEVDIYRYLWDGIAAETGVSPYRYTPEEVIYARGRRDVRGDLKALAEIGDSTAAIRQLLGRVHFGQIPTVYPPVSQWGFQLVERLTPDNATLAQRMLRMRVWLVLCDLATLLVLLAILRMTDLHPAYAILYGWSPLVIKEIANSGHLDSMAVLLTTLGVYFCVRLLRRKQIERFVGPALADAVAAASGLALGIGAKIYPVVLLPWFAALAIRRLRWAAIIPLATVGLLSALILRPMFVEDESMLRPPSDGIKTFFKYWEMNDLLFLITVENLRPDNRDAAAPWFVIVPNTMRQRTAATLERWTGLPRREATFQGARIITAAIFAAIVLWITYGAWKADTPRLWLRAAFLTLAWFWLLSPTQNPWYWIWAMPLLPFAKHRAWYLISGVVFAYYLRFWLEYHFQGVPVWNTPYRGTLFFDLVVTPLEFAPWLALLAIEAWWQREPDSDAPVVIRRVCKRS